jgi:predicted house-cleaning noncanonical NTP pyrophosphatase (MazG superfamily)
MVACNKLVRDKIPELIEANGERAKTRILALPEFLRELGRKIVEEADEVAEVAVDGDRDEVARQIADLIEATYTLAHMHSISPAEIDHVRRLKWAERGGFEKRIFLESTEERR